MYLKAACIRWLLLSAALCTVAFTAPCVCADTPVYQDASATVQQRVDDLMSRMTLEEKAEQLRCVAGMGRRVVSNGQFDPAKAAPLLSNGIGEVAPMDDEVNREVTLRNKIQSYLIHNTRLGIPAIFHDEACHGFRDIGATSFPAPIGLACSWDPVMLEQIYNVVAAEMRARGVSHALAPVVDIDRDPRWGRADETMGEDPYLNGTLAAAVVRGLQGSSTGEIAQGHVAATLKHFCGHGMSEGGINRAPGDIPLREMYDAHLVPFRIAIAQGHPAAIMPSYNEVNGVPSHDNSWLLQDVLRKEFNFTGLVVSDYQGVEYLAQVHHVAADEAGAAAEAINCGVQLNLPDGVAYRHLVDLVKDGKVSANLIDRDVRAVLTLKFSMGLFDQPYGDAKKAADLAALDSSKALARKAADESIVLLKNKDDILPLAKGKYATIAVIGPNADEDRLGSYSGEPLYQVSILKGITDKAGNSSKVVYARGCQIVTNLPHGSLRAWRDEEVPKFPTEAQTQADVSQAVAVAQQADLIVLVLGENEMISRESVSANRLGDRADLDLAGGQNDLADAIFAMNKPVVVYLMNGRPLAIPNIVDRASAVLEGWYMGQEGGNAAADVLFGDVNPSGKLTITFPQSVGQVPDYYDCKPGARLFDYVDETNKPLFPFGFGLSYTTFSYADPMLSSPTLSGDDTVTVSETVTNTGSVAGDEIVEMYTHEQVSSVTRPVKELKGFSRIHLEAGQSRTVAFPLNRDALKYHNIHMDYTVEAGDVDVMVGPSSAELKKTVLHVTP